jgi:hypothetical protein
MYGIACSCRVNNYIAIKNHVFRYSLKEKEKIHDTMTTLRYKALLK